MQTYTIDVTHRITLTLDDAKIKALMPGFNKCITDFGEGDEALRDHARYLAELFSCGVYSFTKDEFIEGYGPNGDVGIKAEFVIGATDVEIIEVEGGQRDGRV